MVRVQVCSNGREPEQPREGERGRPETGVCVGVLSEIGVSLQLSRTLYMYLDLEVHWVHLHTLS